MANLLTLHSFDCEKKSIPRIGDNSTKPESVATKNLVTVDGGRSGLGADERGFTNIMVRPIEACILDSTNFTRAVKIRFGPNG